MNFGMNTGTKARTIAFALCCVNQAVASVGEIDFGSHTVNVVYKVISTALTIIVGAIALYYNNDFTVEADTHTKLMRQEKALRDHLPITVDEPDDAEVFEEESEVKDGDE